MDPFFTGKDAEQVRLQLHEAPQALASVPNWKLLFQSRQATWFMLGFTLVYPIATWRNMGVVKASEALAWAWVVLMVAWLARLVLATPSRRWYGIIKAELPISIRRDDIHALRFSDRTLSHEVRQLLGSLRAKIAGGSIGDSRIGGAAQESDVVAFFDQQIELIESGVERRYAKAVQLTQQIEKLGFIGTLIGIIAAVITGSIDLVIVSTAFITSLIGLLGKTFWMEEIEDREGFEQDQILNLRSWIVTNIFGRLSMPQRSQTVVSVEPGDFALELARQLRPVIAAISQRDEALLQLLYEVHEEARPDLRETRVFTVGRSPGTTDLGPQGMPAVRDTGSDDGSA